METTSETRQRDEVMAGELVGAARDVLNVMFFTDILEEGESYEGPVPLALQVRVRFSGDHAGEFRMEVDDLAAGSMAGSFLGADGAEGLSAEEVEQVMGELGNMICGAFLSRYEKECLFYLSPPEVLRLADGEMEGVRRTLLLMEGLMDLRVRWGTA